MDGNGRWATERSLRRSAGHRAGAKAVERTVEAAPSLGITDLTLYAFSSDNWQRPRGEVTLLMRLFRSHLETQSERCAREGIQLNVIGRRDRLDDALLEAITRAEALTACGTTMTLRIAVDYSGRDSIVTASRFRPADREAFSDSLSRSLHSATPMPDVDLLIRTGREKRLSDFLLWEASYAELVFLDVMWPDFAGEHLSEAVDEFTRRTRRFGRVERRGLSVALIDRKRSVDQVVHTTGIFVRRTAHLLRPRIVSDRNRRAGSRGRPKPARKTSQLLTDN